MAEPVLTLVKASDLQVGDLFPDGNLTIMRVRSVETAAMHFDMETVVIDYMAYSGGGGVVRARMFRSPDELFPVFRTPA